MQTQAVAASLRPPSDCFELRFVGLPGEQIAKDRLPGHANAVIAYFVAQVDVVLLSVLRERTLDEIYDRFFNVSHKYVDLVQAFDRVVKATESVETLDEMSSETFVEMESDLTLFGPNAFGQALTDRGLFTVSVLRTTCEYLSTVCRLDPSVISADDRKILDGVFQHSVRARFAVDCLSLCIRNSKVRLTDDATVFVANELRCAVDALVWSREAVRLRVPDQNEDFGTIALDDDDEQFLKSLER